MGDLEFESWYRQEIFSSPKHPDQLVAHSDSRSVVTGALFLGVKWLGHEASHWPPLSAEVKNEYSLLPGLHSMYRANFPFNFHFTVTETADKIRLTIFFILPVACKFRYSLILRISGICRSRIHTNAPVNITAHFNF